MKQGIGGVLKELEAQSALERTKRNVPAPDRMLAITKETGEMLNMILRLKDAKSMLEIGTSVGYSTIWCAEAISENAGEIVTIERNPEKIKRARKNLQRAGVADTVTIIEGTALEILEGMGKECRNRFDMVLIDADKENVIEYFDLILPMVAAGGVIITDNMLYPEKYRRVMAEFSKYIRTKPDIVTTTSTIGNGEEITIKKR